MRTQKVSARPKKPPKKKPKLVAKKRKGMTVVIDASLRADLIKSIENEWRQLAADAIRDFREIANVTDDPIRNTALRSVSALERRLAVLAGQLEMFT